MIITNTSKIELIDTMRKPLGETTSRGITGIGKDTMNVLAIGIDDITDIDLDIIGDGKN